MFVLTSHICKLIKIDTLFFFCSRFDNNVASRGSTDTTAVTAYRVLITFYGINTFNNNFGGGLSLLSSRMDVRGNLTFNNNTAVFGGGIAMSGRSLVCCVCECVWSLGYTITEDCFPGCLLVAIILFRYYLYFRFYCTRTHHCI